MGARSGFSVEEGGGGVVVSDLGGVEGGFDVAFALFAAVMESRVGRDVSSSLSLEVKVGGWNETMRRLHEY